MCPSSGRGCRNGDEGVKRSDPGGAKVEPARCRGDSRETGGKHPLAKTERASLQKMLRSPGAPPIRMRTSRESRNPAWADAASVTRSPERSRDRSPTQVQLASRSVGPVAAACVRRCPDLVRQELARGARSSRCDPGGGVRAHARRPGARERAARHLPARDPRLRGAAWRAFSLIETLDVVHSFGSST